MDVLQVIIGLICLVLWVLSVFAMIEIFHIGSTLRQILEAIKSADARRRAEFNAMSAPDGE